VEVYRSEERRSDASSDGLSGKARRRDGSVRGSEDKSDVEKEIPHSSFGLLRLQALKFVLLPVSSLVFCSTTNRRNDEKR